MNINQTKLKIQNSSLLSDKEKSEWLSLLPKMSVLQMEELNQILDSHAPKGKFQTNPPPTGDLPKGDKSQILKPPPLAPRPEPRRIFPEKLEKMDTPKIGGLAKVKSYTAGDMKKYPSIHPFLEAVKAEMKAALAGGAASAAEILDAFEQSPFYKSYLDAGLAMLGGGKTAELSREEFEAVTDFRGGLRNLH